MIKYNSWTTVGLKLTNFFLQIVNQYNYLIINGFKERKELTGIRVKREYLKITNPKQYISLKKEVWIAFRGIMGSSNGRRVKTATSPRVLFCLQNILFFYKTCTHKHTYKNTIYHHVHC